MLVVDRTHLQGKFKGVMLSVNSVDENGQIYPVAFAVVEWEDLMHEHDSSRGWNLLFGRYQNLSSY